MLFGEKYHRWFYLIGLSMMAAALPLGKYFLGASLFTIGINWVLESSRPDPIWATPSPFRNFFRDMAEKNFKPKFRLLRARPAIAVLMGFVLLHVIGTLWAPDQHDAWRDVKIKLPLLLVPLVIGTTPPLEKRFFEWLLFAFTAAVLVSSISTVLIAKGILHSKREIHTIRDASVFVPLIRLSLMVVMAVFILARWTIRNKNFLIKGISVIVILWFTWFLLYTQSLTGLVILFSGGFLLLVFMGFIYRKNFLAIGLIACFVIAASIAGFQLKRAYDQYFNIPPVDVHTLPRFTARGNFYLQRPDKPFIENGHFVMINVCWPELDSCWTRRSAIPLSNGLDANGNAVATTLLRYLTSKNLKKDAEGMSQLSDSEIRAIESGVTNAHDSERTPIERRIYQVCWELYHYRHGGNPSGNSVTMRFELAKTATSCIREHPLTGVGTGGQEKAFNAKYEKEGTKLTEDWQWLHSHNQLLSVAVTLGIPGLLYFLFSLWYAPKRMKRWRSYLYLAFFIVVFMSFFDDDTLETEQGVFFFAFFNCLLLYAMPRESAIHVEENKSMEL